MPTQWIAFLLAVVAASLVTGFLVWTLTRSTPVEQPITRSVIPLAPGGEIGEPWLSSVAISPDARYVAYIEERGGSRQLCLRATDELYGRPIEGTEGAGMPFFSPDSQWLGFQAGGKLMKVSLRGGAPVVICDTGEDPRGASWSPDGTIVFNFTNGAGLARVSASGGVPDVLTTPNREQGERTHRLPEVLPGGKAVLFTVGTNEIESWDDASIAVLSLDSGEYRVLIEGGTNPRYIPMGHLVYARAGALLAAAFDLSELRVKGAPVSVLEGVVTQPASGGALFGTSQRGSLVYAPGRVVRWESRVLSVDRGGRSETLLETQRTLEHARVSPDGRLLAFEVDSANSSVWLYDRSRSTLTPHVTGFDNATPVWSPKGDRIAFRSNREGEFNLFWQAADGSAPPERLTASEYRQHPSSWSPDGKMLAYQERRPETGWDLWLLSMDGERVRKPLLQTRSNEKFPMFSPDGRWIAYDSDESGQYEVYLRPFPGSGGKKQISTGGGIRPAWSADGRELFYRNGDKMMVVQVHGEGEPTLGKPTLLFERPFPTSEQRDWDVATDGQHFIIIEWKRDAPPKELILVQNWSEELKRLVPAN